MAVIASRSPYLITQNVDNLSVQIKSWPQGEAEPAEWQYTINKVSYTDGVAEDLTIDVAPYISAKFTMVPLSGTIDGSTQIPNTEYLEVKIAVNTVEELHTAVNGYTSPTNNYFFDHWQVRKSITYDTDSMLTIGTDGLISVVYYLDNGATYNLPLTTTDRYHVIPVAYAGVPLENSNTLDIHVTYNTGLIVYPYKISCPADEGTIGFVNAVGMWEYFDVLGRQKREIKRESKQYRAASDAQLKMYNVNGERYVDVNTGWQDEQFRRVIEDLMMSEHMVWHQGSIYDNLILETSTQRTKTNRWDKMISYDLRFKYAKKVR